jgi:predicted small secreted protein
MKMIARAFAFAVLLGVTIATFSGCRTAHGFGEDMEKAGHSIQDGTDR